jgi:hypothetical protein
LDAERVFAAHGCPADRNGSALPARGMAAEARHPYFAFSAAGGFGATMSPTS